MASSRFCFLALFAFCFLFVSPVFSNSAKKSIRLEKFPAGSTISCQFQWHKHANLHAHSNCKVINGHAFADPAPNDFSNIKEPTNSRIYWRYEVSNCEACNGTYTTTVKDKSGDVLCKFDTYLGAYSGAITSREHKLTKRAVPYCSIREGDVWVVTYHEDPDIRDMLHRLWH